MNTDTQNGWGKTSATWWKSLSDTTQNELIEKHTPPNEFNVDVTAIFLAEHPELSRDKEGGNLKQENERLQSDVKLLREALEKIISINAAPSIDELISKLKLVAYAALEETK